MRLVKWPLVVASLVVLLLLPDLVSAAVPYIQQARLTAADAEAATYLGQEVAISGDTALVGAAGDDEGGPIAGAAYVFVRSGTSWSQQAKLLSPDVGESVFFGWSVAISGDTAVVTSTRPSAAYIFVRSGTTWTQQAKLTVDSTAWVALEEDTLLLGVPGDSELGTGAGAVFVYSRDGVSWSQQAKLTADDGAVLDQFGAAVAIAGNVALIGARFADESGENSGAAYVFVRTGTDWSQQAKLTADDGAPYDELGRTVAVSGDTALVGASKVDDSAQDSGAAYVFARTGTTWVQQAKLMADDGALFDYFGDSLATTSETAFVGAWSNDGAGLQSGGVYAFGRTGTAWTQQAKFVGDDTAAGDLLGMSMALSGNTLVVGASGKNVGVGPGSGSAYVFVPADDDGDGVPNDLDVCPETVIPEGVPTRRLGVNRWALTDGDGVFDTKLPRGGGAGPGLGFTIEGTGGCSCEQIIDALRLGRGHMRFGCSIGAMRVWVNLVNP